VEDQGAPGKAQKSRQSTSVAKQSPDPKTLSEVESAQKAAFGRRGDEISLKNQF
jgi:hypothetical protein